MSYGKLLAMGMILLCFYKYSTWALISGMLVVLWCLYDCMSPMFKNIFKEKKE